MADRGVNVIVLIIGVGDGIQRSDGAALDNIKLAVRKAPFNILRAAHS